MKGKNDIISKYNFVSFKKKAIDYVKSKQNRLSSFNPIIDMAFEIGILSANDWVIPITLFDKSCFLGCKDIYETQSFWLFLWEVWDRFIPDKEFDLVDLKNTYSDRVSYMFINWILYDYMLEHKDYIRKILVESYWIWSPIFTWSKK